MKTITSHQINECNEAIGITTDEPDPSNGNASHNYVLKVQGRDGPIVTVLAFQHGPIKEVGTNGVTHEALLAIILDRLNGFQSGQYACPENAVAIEYLNKALGALHARTRARDERGVEGTHQV